MPPVKCTAVAYSIIQLSLFTDDFEHGSAQQIKNTEQFKPTHPTLLWLADLSNALMWLLEELKKLHNL